MAILHFDDVVTFNGALCDFSSNIPDEKGVSDKKIQVKPLDILCVGTTVRHDNFIYIYLYRK